MRKVKSITCIIGAALLLAGCNSQNESSQWDSAYISSVSAGGVVNVKSAEDSQKVKEINLSTGDTALMDNTGNLISVDDIDVMMDVQLKFDGESVTKMTVDLESYEETEPAEAPVKMSLVYNFTLYQIIDYEKDVCELTNSYVQIGIVQGVNGDTEPTENFYATGADIGDEIYKLTGESGVIYLHHDGNLYKLYE